MNSENLLATLEQGLRQARATRSRLAARLADLEAEAERVRAEVSEMDALVSQTEASMFRILSGMFSAGSSTSTPTDAEIEAALRRDSVRAVALAQAHAQAQQQPQTPAPVHAPAVPSIPRQAMPAVRSDVEPTTDRFLDRTIPQATAMILREAGGPLHVNEIYNRLVEGSFQFTGQHPTISIAVSLNRNRRFRKVAPGTFDLTIRDAAQTSTG